MNEQGIGWAVKQLQMGERVKRLGWNGPHMWLSLTPGRTVQAEQFWSPHNRRFAENAPDRCAYVESYVTLKTERGTIIPWICSQADLLATDWVLVEGYVR